MDGMTTAIASINGMEGMKLAFQIGAQDIGGKSDSANLESVIPVSGSNPNASTLNASNPSSEIDVLA